MQPLTIFYTASLRGRLEVLPRLFTFIRHERTALKEASLLLDLGGSCIPGNWLCDATQGRAPLVAMDSMGYDAFCLSESESLPADPVTLGKLRDTILTPVVTTQNPLTLTRHDVSIPVNIAITPQGVQVSIGADSIRLVETGVDLALGRVELSSGADDRLIAHASYRAMPESTVPDPTISSVIEFVESEARYATRKR